MGKRSNKAKSLTEEVSEKNNPRKRAKTDSEAGHFMDSKENKLYYFIQLELLRLKNLTKIFGEEQSPRY